MCTYVEGSRLRDEFDWDLEIELSLSLLSCLYEVLVLVCEYLKETGEGSASRYMALERGNTSCPAMKRAI